MTVTLFASGTQTCVIGVEEFLSSPNVVGEFSLLVNNANMAAGDVMELRQYKMPLTGGAALCEFVWIFYGAQPTDFTVAETEFIPNTLTDTNAVRYSIKQTFGTGRNFDWAVRNRDNGANVTAWNGTPVGSPDTAGYPVVTVKHGTGAGEINVSSGNVPIQAGTGTGQLDFTSGVVKSNLVQILGTALTETSGQIAAAFKKFFDIASPTGTANRITLVDTATNLTNAPTNGDFTTAMKTSLNAATPVVTVSGWAAGAVQALFDTVITFNAAGSVGKLWNDLLTAIKTVTDKFAFTTPNRVDATALAVGDKTGYSLTSSYDAAKTAATQTSVNTVQTTVNTIETETGGIAAIPTNPLLTDDARLPSGATPISTLTQAQVLSDATPFPGADIALIKAKTDTITAPHNTNIDATLALLQAVTENVTGVRFTTHALMEAPVTSTAGLSTFNPAVDPVIVGDIIAEGLAELFSRDSGETHDEAVAGSVIYEILNGITAETITVPAIVNGLLDALLAGHTTAATVGEAISLIASIVAQIGSLGTVLVNAQERPSTLRGVELEIGIDYMGGDAMPLTSNSMRDLLASGITVALEYTDYANIRHSFPASTITGAPGSWQIIIPVSGEDTAALTAFEGQGELAVYKDGARKPRLGFLPLAVSDEL